MVKWFKEIFLFFYSKILFNSSINFFEINLFGFCFSKRKADLEILIFILFYFVVFCFALVSRLKQLYCVIHFCFLKANYRLKKAIESFELVIFLNYNQMTNKIHSGISINFIKLKIKNQSLYLLLSQIRKEIRNSSRFP